MKQFTVNNNDAVQRADRFVSKVCLSLPDTLLQKSFRKGRVKVNKKKVLGSYRLQEGDLIELYINDEFFSPPEQKQAIMLVKPDLDIVYEDENIIICNKPAGMLVHSDDKESVNTLITHILAYLMEKGEYAPEKENSFTPALCHRLDRNTCGLVISAKNAEALRVMNDIIKHRMIKKLYLCTVVGTPIPRAATVSAYLRRDLDKAQVFVTKEPRKNSVLITTAYRVLEEYNGLSRLEIDLITGRTHQIRAHMAFIGHPLAGDGKYGINAVNKKLGMTHQDLCAYKISFLSGFEDTVLGYLQGKEFTANV